jgi:undecaprenyl-diphosphatase
MNTFNPREARSQDQLNPRQNRMRPTRAEAVYSIAVVAFSVLAILAHLYAYFGWDLLATHELQSVHSIHGFMYAVSVFGNGWIPWVISAVTITLLLVFKFRFEAWGLLLSVAGGEALNRLIKLIIGRPRPAANLVEIMQVERTQSFPSGHVTFYVCYFGFLFFLAYTHLPRGSFARRAALTICALPILLIGFSRVYLGVHWPSDVLGAYLFGGLWLGFSLHVYRKWKMDGN